MPIWSVAAVEQQPEIILSSWQIMEIAPAGTRHFMGYNETDREGRASTAIVHFDIEKRIGVTASGRVYQLIGDPGEHPDADYTWGRWMFVNEIERWEVVTEKVLRGEYPNADHDR